MCMCKFMLEIIKDAFDPPSSDFSKYCLDFRSHVHFLPLALLYVRPGRRSQSVKSIGSVIHPSPKDTCREDIAPARA